MFRSVMFNHVAFIKVAQDLGVKEISDGVELPSEEAIEENIAEEAKGYPCNQCDYQATTQSKLQAHISAKHSDTVL